MLKLYLNLVLLGFSLVFCQVDINAICEERADEGLDYVRHPTDCSSYIGCEEPPFTGSCGEYYFNEETQICDEIQNVQCDIESEPETTIILPATEPPTTTTETTPPPTTAEEVITDIDTTEELVTTDIPNPTTIEPVEELTTKTAELLTCPEGDEQIIFLPSKNSCEDYFFCFNGVPLAMQCADNLQFNAKKGKCDFKENVKCTAGRPRCTQAMNKFFAHESSCNMFYYCRFGHLTIQRCPYFYNWNDEQKECQLNYGDKCS